MLKDFPGRDFKLEWKSYRAHKKVVEDRVIQQKQHMRKFLIERVLLHQIYRNHKCSLFTETHRQITLDLFELSVGRYSEVIIIIFVFTKPKTITNLFSGKNSGSSETFYGHLKFQKLLYSFN